MLACRGSTDRQWHLPTSLESLPDSLKGPSLKGPSMAKRGFSGLVLAKAFLTIAAKPPLQGGRGSLKGRGASQAPSLPFKANL